jgi:molecular chaperone GrpE
VNDNNSPSAADTADLSSAQPADASTALAAAEAKANDNLNSYLRAVAEFDNYRKRMDRELENARKYAVERFAQELVPVVDSLEAALSAGAANSGAALIEGTSATLKQLQRAFDKAGIKAIDPQSEAFDPEWHEAMVAQESTDTPPNRVLSVIQKGYSLNGRLLRPARVIVSKASGGDAN